MLARKLFGPIWVGPLCIVAMFQGVLAGTDRFAFRDVSYFYTPLYDYVAKRCAAQRWGGWGAAIWNPLDLTGMPLAGETTTAVFYPIRILVYAFGGSAERSIGVYVVLHLVIASLAAYWLVRTYRGGPWMASVAGVVYPLSGSILFLATNPPFLVSAAWLPILMGSLLHRRGRVVMASVAMAMMILGGDPSTAFHAALVTGVVAAGRFWVQWLVTRSFRWKWKTSLLAKLVLTCLFATGLSAPQIVSSLDWSRQSDRVSNPQRLAHAQAFSFPPWRVIEFALPNLYGTPWPIHHRWDRIAFDQARQRPETALWTPSTYMGGLVWILLPCACVRWERNRFRWQRRIDWPLIGGFALVASLGVYAPLSSVMLEWVPGYDSLRYPSKWLPFVSLAIAFWLSKMSSQMVTRPFFGVLAVGVSLALVTIGWLGWILHHLPVNVTTADDFWGPFQMRFATSSFNRTIIHSLTFMAAFVGIFAGIKGWSSRLRFVIFGRRWFPILLALICLDLLIAHQDLIPRVNRDTERSLVQAPPPMKPSLRWMNTLARGGALPRWRLESSEDRMVKVEAALRSSWFGRWHLEHEQAKFNSLVSIQPAAFSAFWNEVRRATDNATPVERDQVWDQWHADLAIDGLIVRDADAIGWNGLESTALRPSDSLNEVVVSDHVDAAMELRNARTVELRRAVYQDGHWTAIAIPVGDEDKGVSPRNLPVRSQFGLSQRATVPPGDWRIQWRYDPWWHGPSKVASVSAWVMVLMILVFDGRRNRWSRMAE